MYDMRPDRGPIASIAFVALFATLAVPAIPAEEVMLDGVPHIRNEATPAEGRETLELEEIWRAGGPEDEETIFGLITDVVGDASGNLYLLDAQLCKVSVYGPDGTHLRSLFRQGEGPGEVLRPRDCVLLSDGSIGAAQEFPGKIIVVDQEGTPQSSVIPRADDAPDAFLGLVSASCRGGNLVVSGIDGRRGERPGFLDRYLFLASYSREGKELARYLTARGDYNFTDFHFTERIHIPTFWWGFAVGPDGRVYASADYDNYSISVFSRDGTLERVIEREHIPRQRRSSEVELMRRNIANAVSGAGIEVTVDVAPTDPAIAVLHRGIHVTDDGQLYVLPSRGCNDQPAGIMLTYDVFDPAGRFVKQLSVACEGDANHDTVFFLPGERVVLVKQYLEALAAMFGSGTPVSGEGEEEAAMEVVCYRITGRSSS